MGGFHMRVDLEGANSEEVDQRRAGAFETALRHAATDPGIRAEMIAADLTRKHYETLFRICADIQNQTADVRAQAMGLIRSRDPILADLIDKAFETDPVLGQREKAPQGS